MKFINQFSVIRILRISIGIFAIAQAFIMRDIIVGILGFAVAGLAVFNKGCCSDNACSIPVKKNDAVEE